MKVSGFNNHPQNLLLFSGRQCLHLWTFLFAEKKINVKVGTGTNRTLNHFSPQKSRASNLARVARAGVLGQARSDTWLWVGPPVPGEWFRATGLPSIVGCFASCYCHCTRNTGSLLYAVRAIERVPADSCHFSCLTNPSQSVVNFPCVQKWERIKTMCAVIAWD